MYSCSPESLNNYLKSIYHRFIKLNIWIGGAYRNYASNFLFRFVFVFAEKTEKYSVQKFGKYLDPAISQRVNKLEL